MPVRSVGWNRPDFPVSRIESTGNDRIGSTVVPGRTDEYCGTTVRSGAMVGFIDMHPYHVSRITGKGNQTSKGVDPTKNAGKGGIMRYRNTRGLYDPDHGVMVPHAI